jgi:deazaflavin-dependent oxidoreductase (nitroreductase family)
VILDPRDAARSVCDLETRGRRSGLPRVLEIWFAADGDTLFLLAGGRDRAHWVRNLRADPRARIRIGERWYAGTAREVEGTPDEARAREAVASKYESFPRRPLSRWARTSLPVAIDLSE